MFWRQRIRFADGRSFPLLAFFPRRVYLGWTVGCSKFFASIDTVSARVPLNPHFPFDSGRFGMKFAPSP